MKKTINATVNEILDELDMKRMERGGEIVNIKESPPIIGAIEGNPVLDRYAQAVANGAMTYLNQGKRNHSSDIEIYFN